MVDFRAQGNSVAEKDLGDFQIQMIFDTLGMEEKQELIHSVLGCFKLCAKPNFIKHTFL